MKHAEVKLMNALLTLQLYSECKDKYCKDAHERAEEYRKVYLNFSELCTPENIDDLIKEIDALRAEIEGSGK